jgi:hypothetical protein
LKYSNSISLTADFENRRTRRIGVIPIREKTEENTMRKTLLASVAVAAVVGFTSVAMAQGAMEQKGGGQAPGATEQKAAPSGGAAMKPEGAAPRSGQSAQGADKMTQPDKSAQGADKMNKPDKSADDAGKSAKPDQRMGQEQKPDQRMGQDKQKSDQRMGEEQKKGATPQRGAAEEDKAQPRGAQTESGKSGTNATEKSASQGPGKAGANVRLSQDQRSRISAVIGRGGGARVNNVNFNVSVGVRVPRDVRVEVLPEDIVSIVPEYRGFDYIVVGDRILIIDPDSLEIVTIIET